MVLLKVTITVNMKTATIFLVAVAVSTTLFQESSTAAVDSTTSECSVKFDPSVTQRFDEAMKSTQQHKISAINIVEVALSTECQGEAEGSTSVKEVLSEAATFAKGLLAICIRLNKEMNDAFATCSIKDLKNILAELVEAINKAKVEWSELTPKLMIVPIDVRTGYIEGMEKNFVIDEGIKEDLKEFVDCTPANNA